MRLYVITFRSVTFAQRAEKMLTRQGFRVSLMRTPRWMEEQGCGYALNLRTRDVRKALDLLRENGIQPRKAYVRQENGDMEEVTL